ncbi:ABC transporter permease [Glaciihabitans arcticus]|uniref:ABC transporter permease n=1 Tax=Glaciihabitans arcticus TaxID=2668039 RepID=A0A4Q9GTI0_9MICO|nr:ABC transporter permease [Glaciihabitans arcticus]TBN55530.1 ABC transporter permease [Glaciihabitans arcticus]
MAVFLTLQSFQFSGAQQANQMVGAYDYSLQTGTFISLGDSGEITDDALQAAIAQAGAVNSIIRYNISDGLTIEDKLSTSVGFEEGDWSDEPFPNRLFIQDGRWPANVSEVTVSSVLAEDYPVGSSVSLFDGNWTATVVGVAKDDFSRRTSTLFGFPGTWNSLATIDDVVAERYGNTANRSVYWSGGDPTVIVDVVADVLSSSEGSQANDILLQQVQSRSELTSRTSSPLIEFGLGSLIAPFVASMVGTIVATRFINRIRAVMLSIGIARRKTGLSALWAIVASLVLGLIAGCSTGIAVGLALRPLLDLASERAIGPVYDVEVMLLGALVASLLGGGLGALLNNVRQSLSARELVAANRAPVHYIVLPILCVVLVTAGYVSAQAAQSTDQMILSGICFALSGVALLPLVLELLLLREPRSMPALLASRRLKAEIRQSGWITSSVSALLVVAFAASTLLASALATVNDSNSSAVPVGQIYFTPPADLPDTAADGLTQEIGDYIGLQPISFFIADGGVDLLDGSTIVVESVTAFETLTGVELSSSEVDLLQNGGTIRTKQPNVPEVSFESSDGARHTFSATVKEGLANDYRRLDGFILRSTAQANDIGLVNQTRVFLNGSRDQLALAESAPIELGFNSEWLTLNNVPDIFSEPVEARIAASTISALAVSIMIFFVLSATRLLRANLSTLRSIGAHRGWLNAVLFAQTSTVLTLAVVGAAFTAVVGMFATIRISGIELQLVIPWQSIGMTILILVAGTLIAAFVSSGRLTNDERFTST